MSEICKVLMLGESTVGKSSIANRFMGRQFKDKTDSTIGAAYTRIATDNNTNINKTTNNSQNKNVAFSLWDTAGQERFNSLIPMYYRDADIALLVFDIKNPKTLHRLKRYIIEINRNVDNCKFIIIGNKIDLIEKNDELIDIDKWVKEELSDLTNLYALQYYFVSAKNEKNLDNLFDYVIDCCATKTPNGVRTEINLNNSSKSTDLVEYSGSYRVSNIFNSWCGN